jgi:hypothetical protein
LSAASIGTSTIAATSDARSEKTTASAWSRKIWPAEPSTKTIGRNTTTVVSVEANTLRPISRVPFTAAWNTPSPSSRRRVTASRTTIELSTSMPTPSARPPKDMTFSDTPIM